MKSVIQSTGVTPNEVQVKALVSALSDVNIEEVLKSAPVAAAPVSIFPTRYNNFCSKRGRKERRKERRGSIGRVIRLSLDNAIILFTSAHRKINLAHSVP